MQTSTDFSFKVLLVGDSSVGKSSTLIQFVEDFEAFDNSQAPTIGVDFKSKTITVNQSSILLNVWDTAGQEKFRSLTASYYKGTQGVMLCFDVTSRRSFQDLDTWLKEVQLYSSHENVALILLGNKIDMGNQREVSFEEGTQWAKSHSMPYFECSAKTKKGVKEAFTELTKIILSRENLYNSKKTSKIAVQVSETVEGEGGMCSC